MALLALPGGVSNIWQIFLLLGIDLIAPQCYTNNKKTRTPLLHEQ